MSAIAADAAAAAAGASAAAAAAVVRADPAVYRFAFVMDQQVGLRTQALNLERAVAADSEVEPAWAPIRYAADLGRWGAGLKRVGVPDSMLGTLRGVREIRDALNGRTFDAVLWATWAAKSVPEQVAAAPAFLRMDMTPVQMEAMGELYGYGRSRARFLGGWKRRATLRLYRRAVHMFPWSAYVADSLRSDYGIPDDRITVISPGVDTALYRPDPASPRRDDGVVRLLFVGGDFARKGGDLLLRWMRERRQAATPAAGAPRVELHLVTRDEVPGPLPDGVIVHAAAGNNSPELVRLYQSADLFVLPTRADCYSLVALEAMASGLPVVVTRLGGIPDIVEDGRTGVLLPPASGTDDGYAALAAALEPLVADEGRRRDMGERARRRAVERFDSADSAARILAAMKETAARARRESGAPAVSASVNGGEG